MTNKVLDCGLTRKELDNVRDGNDILLSSTIVIQRINTKRSTFEKWVREGKFPEPKTCINGKARWLESQLTNWLLNNIARTA